MKFDFSRNFFEKFSNIKFHENPSSGRRVVSCGQTDRHGEADSCFSKFCERASKQLCFRACLCWCFQVKHKNKIYFVMIFFPPLPVYILQSVWGHSAVVLTVTINGIQEIHPVIHLLFLSSSTSDWCLAPHRWCFYITHNDAPQSVGLLWASGQLVAETSTWQHTTLKADRHPCGRWDSNPRTQQASGRRPKHFVMIISDSSVDYALSNGIYDRGIRVRVPAGFYIYPAVTKPVPTSPLPSVQRATFPGSNMNGLWTWPLVSMRSRMYGVISSLPHTSSCLCT